MHFFDIVPPRDVFTKLKQSGASYRCGAYDAAK
jgi:hypothetical protein